MTGSEHDLRDSATPSPALLVASGPRGLPADDEVMTPLRWAVAAQAEDVRRVAATAVRAVTAAAPTAAAPTAAAPTAAAPTAADLVADSAAQGPSSADPTPSPFVPDVFDKEGIQLHRMAWYVRGYGALRLTRGTRRGRRRGLPRQERGTPVVPPEQRVFGVPGGPCAHGSGVLGDAGDDQAALDTLARLLTARLLEPLLWIPGARVLHGLASLTRPVADADHGVLCGRRLALIDSHHWAFGECRWSPTGVELTAPSRRAPVPALHLAEAVRDYREAFPGLEVRGWHAAHASRGGAIRADNTAAFDRPRLASPEQLLDEVGTWLAEGTPTDLDLDVLGDLTGACSP